MWRAGTSFRCGLWPVGGEFALGSSCTAVACGPASVHGTTRGALAGATLNEDIRDTSAGTAVVESTDSQKSPDSTYNFEALSGTESSTAWKPMAYVTVAKGVQAH